MLLRTFILLLLCSYYTKAVCVNLNKMSLQEVTINNPFPSSLSAKIVYEKLCSNCKDTSETQETITIKGNSTHTPNKEPHTKIANIILPADYGLFIEQKNDHRALLTIITKKEEQKAFPIHKTYSELFDQDPKLALWQHDYTTYSLEGVSYPFSPADFVALFNKLYEKNNLTKCLPTRNNKLPKIIHHIWFGSTIPLLYKKWQKTWKKQHPEWRTICWTEEMLPLHFPQGLFNQTTFDTSFNYAQKSDIVRYELLFKFGGVYVDCDFVCFENIDHLTHCYDFFTGIEAHMIKLFLPNAFIGAIPQHPIVKQCMDNIKFFEQHPEAIAHITDSPTQSKAYINFYTTLITTGPACFMHAVWLRSLDSNYRNIIFPSAFVYPWSRTNHNPSPVGAEAFCNHVSKCPTKEKAESSWGYQSLNDKGKHA